MSRSSAAVVGDYVPGGVAGVRRNPYYRGRTEKYAHLFGVLPDTEIADLAGVAVATVQAGRVRRGVAPVADEGRPPGSLTDHAGTLRRIAQERGRVTSQEAVAALGVTGRQLLVLCARRGHLVRVSRGVYALPPTPSPS